MATIDLGKIKLVNRGAYDNATAYTVDDLVQSGGSTYICIQNSTGNAVSNNSYWSVLAQGGTDVSTTLTTEGDILYRDGSGLQRLAKGTAAQVLKMNTAANAPEWGNLSSDYVKIYEADDVTAASEINLNGYFNDNYKVYKIYMCTTSSSGGGGFYMRVRTGTNGATENSASDYESFYNYNNKADNNNTQTGFSGTVNSDSWRLAWNGDGTTTNHQVYDLTFYEPNGTSQRPHWTGLSTHYDNAYKGFAAGGGFKEDEVQITGIKFFHSSGNIGMKWVKIYGLK